MASLNQLVELQTEDPELMPEIVPVDARMSIRGPVAAFISLFERAAGVTPTKEILHGTGYALLEAVPSTHNALAHARVSATDGMQTIAVVNDDLFVLMPGAVLLPPKKVLDILKSAPSETARIEVIGGETTIRSGRAVWRVKTPLGEALPPVAAVDRIVLHDVLRGPLLRALVVARRAVRKDGRDALQQVMIRDGAATGTDGARLHRQRIEGFPQDLELTIPVAVVDELIRALKISNADYIHLGRDANHLVFNIDEDTLIANRLLLAYPDVETLVLGPSFTNQHNLTVDKLELFNAIKRVRVNSDPDYSSIFLALIPGNRDSDGVLGYELAVRARDKVGNSAQESIECNWIGNEKSRELCVNHRHLAEFVASVAGDTITFKIGDDIKSTRNPLFIENETVGFTGYLQQMRAER